MRFLDTLAERLSRSDMVQGAVLLFVALGFLLAIRWPTGISLVNESWFALAPARTTLLAFAALGYGAFQGSRPALGGWRPGGVEHEPRAPLGGQAWRHESAATLGSILVLTAVSAPFEIATHAASYPGTSVGWSLLAPFIAVFGYFGAGLAIGRAAAAVRLRGLLPILVPALLVGGIYLDISVGNTIVNPWSAALVYSPIWLLVLIGLSLLNLGLVLPRRVEAGRGKQVREVTR